jgi:hypothetical protein
LQRLGSGRIKIADGFGVKYDALQLPPE